ncbi:DUF262 domain-containing protein [Melittangium boletus]|uniref:DUF262 domain-containing protein n=1 Tax=Melittangium boletus TaxID=83453 RepID=UPI003DA2EA0A
MTKELNEEMKTSLKEITDEDVEEWFESDEETEEDVVQSDLSIEERYSTSQLQIVRSTMDFTLHNLKQSLGDNSYINLAPDYQRRSRWDRKKRSQLIESFLMNVPVPPVFLFENEYNQYEVMDGRQRLEAVNDFLNDKFPLAGLAFWPELNGSRFSKLPSTIQRGLLRRTISAIVLLAETKREASNVDVRMILFRRLNTGGVRLNPQELRNALYPGLFNNMLIRLARSELFTRIWGIPGPTSTEKAKLLPPNEQAPSTDTLTLVDQGEVETDKEKSVSDKEKLPTALLRNSLYKTMADCELVLRFFAIKEATEGGLKGSLKTILDRCMNRHSKDTEDMVRLHEAVFAECLAELDLIFDGKPFVIPSTSKTSRPLYDALMVALSLAPRQKFLSDKQGIKDRLEAAVADKEKYDILVGRGNTVESIKSRVLLAEKILIG